MAETEGKSVMALALERMMKSVIGEEQVRALTTFAENISTGVQKQNALLTEIKNQNETIMDMLGSLKKSANIPLSDNSMDRSAS